jgi:hypothetical protein
MKALGSFETVRDIYPNGPEVLVSQCENRFATNKILQPFVISSG